MITIRRWSFKIKEPRDSMCKDRYMFILSAIKYTQRINSIF